MGMIYKRGKVFWIKYYRSGKPYRESTESHKEEDISVIARSVREQSDI